MTPSQKLRSIADSTGLDGIADAIRDVANEIEHPPAPAVPQVPVLEERSPEYWASKYPVPLGYALVKKDTASSQEPAVPQVSAIKSALNGMLTFFGMDEDENSKPVFDKARNALTLEFQPYTTIDMGHGKFEVGAGKNGGLPCIAFGRNGTGKVGEPMTTGPRQMSVEETFAVITFANVTGLDVLQETMDQVREEFFPGTTPQFSATPAPAHAVPQGWKLVPVEIDPDMVGAFVDASAIEGPCWAEATDGEKQEVVRMWAQCWAALLAATPAAPSQPAVPQGEQIKKALGKLKSTQMCHPNAVQCLIEEAIDALATTPAPAPAHAFNGWYCAHCQRGVDGSEVTYHEQHTVCGRVITDDVPPAPAPAQGEPFGYFRAEPFGWTDCAEDDEGAIALYERPQESELRKELDSANDFIKSLADLIQKYEKMLGYRTTNAPEGAYALAEAKGESSLNTELDLACADFTCQHDFALDPKSSIRICLKCGTPERLSKNAPAPAQEVPEINYTALIEAAFAKNRKWAQGTTGCIAFARGAEWFREQVISSIGAKPAQEVGQGDHVSIGRVMAEQWLSAMEGVIDVADRKTDEFDALRKSIIDLTLLLHAGPAPTQNGELTVDAVMAIFQKRFPRTRLSNAWRDSAEDIIAALRAKGGT